jgi:hypothetical protein
VPIDSALIAKYINLLEYFYWQPLSIVWRLKISKF